MSAPTAVEVGQSYFELYHRLHRSAEEEMNAAGLSLSRTKTLTELAAQGPVKQATLAAALGFAPRSVTEIVDALERDGYAVRRIDPQDRRARLVEITPAGRTVLQRGIAVKRSVLDRLFGCLDDAERTQFVALLAAIRTELQMNGKAPAHVS